MERVNVRTRLTPHQVDAILKIDVLGDDWCKSMKRFGLVGNGDVDNAIRLQEIVNKITQNGDLTKEECDHQVELYESVLTDAYIKASQGEKWVGFRQTMPEEKPFVADKTGDDFLGEFDSSWDDTLLPDGSINANYYTKWYDK